MVHHEGVEVLVLLHPRSDAEAFLRQDGHKALPVLLQTRERLRARGPGVPAPCGRSDVWGSATAKGISRITGGHFGLSANTVNDWLRR